MVAFDEMLNTNIAKFNKLHAELLRDQLERVLATEAQEAINAKQEYYHAVLEYDACRANLDAAQKQINTPTGPPNVASAKEFLKLSKQKYQNSKKKGFE
mmetsp:Transcript_23832/g.42222  ORF Transcript_23832/g.42222 Transcript_23832/m.42222 type:complete len:99 (+) Transcript_23832:1983-2279(+)